MASTQHTASTEPLRHDDPMQPEVAVEPPTPQETPQTESTIEPSPHNAKDGISAADHQPRHEATQPATHPSLQIPGIAVAHADGTADERGRSTTQPTAGAATPNGNLSATASRAPSPNPSALYPHTQVVFEDPDFATPPPLNYSLRPRKKSIFWFWFLIFLDCVCMPIGLYFGMWYGLTRDQLSANAVFSISTALLGTVSIVEYFIRFRRLWRKNSNCRVIGAKRFYLDWFHWNLSVGWFFVMIELIAGTCPHDPPIRVLAIPASTMLFAIGVELLIVDILRIFGVRAPCRISSLPMGAPLRPGIYAYIEDICAVDGSGGTEFRQRLNLRYQASKAFREMLHHLTLFWAIGAIVCSAVTVAIVFTIQRDAAYIVGWVLPFLWAGIWTAITIPWVQRSLAHEYEQWTTAKWKA
ncbi:hypothetical protein DPSP01_001365 [Paraphaeosphaeria sporulosa]|uniref:Uncharacterized protein n=1 Tax=Paraphaeosphaeria sporulosa TaxID=1460663 RepID=A0A177BZI0_9PLEO|nr:uncharacterized protein CC84DRAFT_1168656 [Paraphaeosphaeria sporulosa]OAG00566.1 hypothetical protein CC84DRAFT_1168656 [Paraphaeosphaeria sporulosa]